MKRVVTMVLALLMVCGIVFAGSAESGTVPVKKMAFTEKKAMIAAGTTYQATVVIEPEDATNKVVEWKSTNEKVATVDENGLITGRGKGNCKIQAIALDGSKKKAEIAVQVKEYDVVIKYPAAMEVYFETTNDYAEYEVGFMGRSKTTVFERTVTFKGDVVEAAGARKLKPVKAGEGTIEVIEKENRKVKSKVKATVYVAPTAVTEEAIPDVENLASGKEIYASTEVPAFWRYYANDGDMESYWESSGYPADLTVNLGGKTQVSSVSLRLNPGWESRTQKIELYVGTDGSNYEKVSDEVEYKLDPKTGNMLGIQFKPVEAQFVLFKFLGGSWPNAQAAEVTVNGIMTDEIAKSGNNW